MQDSAPPWMHRTHRRKHDVRATRRKDPSSGPELRATLSPRSRAGRSNLQAALGTQWLQKSAIWNCRF